MKYIIHIFVFFCFFPYINIFHLGTDTQPNAFLFALIILFSAKEKKLNIPILFFFLCFLMACILALNSQLAAFTTIKTLFNYLSTSVICFAGYTVFIKTNYRVSFKYFFGIVLIYFIIGFIQFTFDPNFLLDLVYIHDRGIRESGRGISSLCSEPAFYGSICIFFMVFSLLRFNRKQNIFIFPLLLIQLFLFAQSATVIGVFGLAVIVFYTIQLLKFKPSYIISFIFLSIIGYQTLSFVSKKFESTRIGSLTTIVIENPMLITALDQSAASRITNSIAFYLNVRHNYFRPQGFGRYQSFLRELYLQGYYKNLISDYGSTEKDRLGGAISMVLFHLGFLGLIFPIAIYLCFKKVLYKSGVQFAFIVFFLILFTQMQLANAIISFLFAVALHESYLDRKRNSSYETITV